MGAEKPAGSGWQQVPVLLRSDIVAAAGEGHLDISDVCNRALAKRLGIEYIIPKARQKEASEVIIAPTGIPAAPAGHDPAAVPVINAEDPMMPGKVMREKKERKTPSPAKKEAPLQKPALSHAVAPAPQPNPLTGDSKTGRKGKKEDAIKRFVSTLLVRETGESPDGIIAKDELYQRFERFCRDHNYSTIPDQRTFAVTLKNRYAFPERTVGGVPSWTSIRIK
ncbi:MAG TPA: primase-like DNA-binding domain-containing protein [Methanoregula sp.]|nr:primase-like DNA-binding domain-containing protein [Methanoregula sp.]